MQASNQQVLELQTPSMSKTSFVSIEGVSKVYPTPTGPYTVLENVN
jgi:bicarbonate transport system ATP-binding protein